MIFEGTKLSGVFVIDLERREDERGFFARSWCADEYAERGLNPRLVQANPLLEPSAGDAARKQGSFVPRAGRSTTWSSTCG
jgi:dTDP-4-dehydrorhamnose 3,5-epimerase